MKDLKPPIQDLPFKDSTKNPQRCCKKSVRSILVVYRYPKHVKGSSYGPIWNTILAFAWTDQRKPQKASLKITNLWAKI
jgi:hypothetical protein